MCGIRLSLLSSQQGSDYFCEQCHHSSDVDQNRLVQNLKRRGPDSMKEVQMTFHSTKLTLQASVLQMRQELTPQPVRVPPTVLRDDDDGEGTTDEEGWLCWNGEIYQAVGHKEAGDFKSSDTRLVVEQFHQAKGKGAPHATRDNVANVLSGYYNAEYAFLWLQNDGRIFFGRDPWGRRSLLRYECSECGALQIASTAPLLLENEHSLHQHDDENENDENENNAFEAFEKQNIWTEIPPGRVYEIDASSSFRFKGSTIIPMAENIPPLPPGYFPVQEEAPPPDVHPDLWKASHRLEYLLSQAVQRRMGHHSTTAILFSGGLDSAVVAALAARHCPQTLRLHNVSFGPTFEKSADRQAAIVTHQTIQAQCPEKNILLEDIIVQWEDICEMETHVRTILQPKSTLMDVNIGSALWFASQGGKKIDSEEENPNHARVLLLGMGADELMGGYGRHRKAFERGGWEELAQELEMDQARFWERNLGRDDRIVADHGREARFPFLDYHVVKFLKSLPLSLVCDFSLPPGQGDKRILRLVAMRLGIVQASGLVKRAIQFGSRISHLSDSKRFGSRRKAKGESVVKCQATKTP